MSFLKKMDPNSKNQWIPEADASKISNKISQCLREKIPSLREKDKAKEAIRAAAPKQAHLPRQKGPVSILHEHKSTDANRTKKTVTFENPNGPPITPFSIEEIKRNSHPLGVLIYNGFDKSDLQLALSITPIPIKEISQDDYPQNGVIFDGFNESDLLFGLKDIAPDA